MIVDTPSDALAGYVQIMRASRNQARPAHLYWLATATTEVTVERVDARTLRIVSAGGALHHDIDRMMRTPRSRPFAAGDRIPLTNLTIEIAAVTPDGRPAEVLARFAAPLEDPSLVWLRWDGRGYVAYRPPAAGGRETFPAVDFAKLLGD